MTLTLIVTPPPLAPLSNVGGILLGNSVLRASSVTTGISIKFQLLFFTKTYS